jgi:hypothetical protein
MSILVSKLGSIARRCEKPQQRQRESQLKTIDTSRQWKRLKIGLAWRVARTIVMVVGTRPFRWKSPHPFMDITSSAFVAG